MRAVTVQLLDQNDEEMSRIEVPLVRTTHVERAIRERLAGEEILEVRKDRATGTWIARVVV